jgi:hypothetical protein
VTPSVAKPKNPFPVAGLVPEATAIESDAVMKEVLDEAQKKAGYTLRSPMDADVDEIMEQIMDTEVTLRLRDLLAMKEARKWVQSATAAKRVFHDGRAITAGSEEEEVENENDKRKESQPTAIANSNHISWISDSEPVSAQANEVRGDLDGVGDTTGDKVKVVDYRFATYATPILDRIIVTGDIGVKRVPVDCGSELNVMSGRMYAAIKSKVTLDQSINMTMRVANGGSSVMLGMVRDLEVAVGPLKYDGVKVWVCEGAPYDLLLGQPFTRLSRQTLKMLASGDQYMEIIGQDDSTAVYNTKVVSRMDYKNVVDFRPKQRKEGGEEKRLAWVDMTEGRETDKSADEKAATRDWRDKVAPRGDPAKSQDWTARVNAGAGFQKPLPVK